MAQRCLVANMPSHWRETSLEGTKDYGLDFQVYTTPNQEVTDLFFIQLKGTASPDFDTANIHMRVPFKTSTLRLYERVGSPIMIVGCDLSVDANPMKCPAYFVWAMNELERIRLASLPPEQAEITVRIPKANVLCATTDIGAYLQRQYEITKAARALNVEVELDRQVPPKFEQVLLPVEAAQSLVAGVPTGEADQVDPAEPEPAAGTCAWFVREASDHLRHGKVERAAELLDSAEALLEAASAKDAARYWYTRGRVRAAAGDERGARDAYAQSMSGRPEENVSPQHACTIGPHVRNSRYGPRCPKPQFDT